MNNNMLIGMLWLIAAITWCAVLVTPNTESTAIELLEVVICSIGAILFFRRRD